MGYTHTVCVGAEGRPIIDIANKLGTRGSAADRLCSNMRNTDKTGLLADLEYAVNNAGMM